MEIFGIHVCQDEINRVVAFLPFVEHALTWLSVRSFGVYRLLRLFV